MHSICKLLHQTLFLVIHISNRTFIAMKDNWRRVAMHVMLLLHPYAKILYTLEKVNQLEST